MARFWTWRSETPATAIADTATLKPEELEPVEIYTPHAMVSGFVVAHGRRLSDILNSVVSLSVRDPRSISFLNGLNGTEGQDWHMVDTDEILFVMPPPIESPRRLHVHRRQHRIRIRTGSFEVVGNAHLIPGIALDPYLLRTRMRFLPLTKAYVRSSHEPEWERNADVVLVNVRPLKDLEEVTTIS